MFFIYAMKSLRTNLWYIGLTLYPEKRRKQHLRSRPDLYAKGHLFKILGRKKTAFAAGALERRLIAKYGTLWPGGHNMHPGGLTGHLLKFVRTYGEDAIAVTPKEGVLYSRKALAEAAKALSAPKETARTRRALLVSLMPQKTRDKIAIAAFQRHEGRSLSPAGIYLRKKRAWARRKAGLKPLPGTEHYLLQPEENERLVSIETRELMSRSQKKRIQRAKKAGTYKPPWQGRQNRVLSQKTKDRIALRAMHRHASTQNEISYKTEWKRRQTFWKRHDKGLPPLPGTEHFLKEPRRRPLPPRSAASRAKQSQTIRDKIAEKKARGEKIPAPKLNPMPRTQRQKDDLATIKIKKGLTNGLFYDYRQILKCSAKAKKRSASGMRPIPGTECFIRLQTALPKGRVWSWAQRSEYKRVMIARVNDWLKEYAIARGWRGENASRLH